jgi:hypothetical protein
MAPSRRGGRREWEKMSKLKIKIGFLCLLLIVCFPFDADGREILFRILTCKKDMTDFVRFVVQSVYDADKRSKGSK